MFTGIIQDILRVKRIAKSGGKLQLCLPLNDVQLGESVAVNGVCLTVDNITKEGVFFTVMGKTLSDTTLRFLKPGSYVNIERALKVGDSISGHFVYGHVCAIGRVGSLKKTSSEIELTILAPHDILKHLKQKGSVAIDGVSLTVQQILGDKFSVAIVRHTLENTIIKFYRPGVNVNIEYELGIFS